LILLADAFYSDPSRADDVPPFSTTEQRTLLMELWPFDAQRFAKCTDLLVPLSKRVDVSLDTVQRSLYIFTDDDAAAARKVIPFEPELTPSQVKQRDSLLQPLDKDIQLRVLRWLKPLTDEEMRIAHEYFDESSALDTIESVFAGGYDDDDHVQHKRDRLWRELHQYEYDKQYRLSQRDLVVVTLVVVINTLYATIVQESLNMIKCDPIDYGEYISDGTFVSRIEQVFFFDRSLRCDSSQHSFYRLMAYMMLALYGLGAPIAAMVTVTVYRRRYDIPTANRIFWFVIGAYTPQWWWWETTVLLRKLLLAFLVVFVDNVTVQTYATMWVLLFGLGATIAVRPYINASLDRLDIFALVATVVSLNLSLLYPFIEQTNAMLGVNILNYVLTVAIMLLNLMVILVFLWFILKGVVLQVQAAIREKKEVIDRRAPRQVAACLHAFAAKTIFADDESKVAKQHREGLRGLPIPFTEQATGFVSTVEAGGTRQDAYQTADDLGSQLRQERTLRAEYERLIVHYRLHLPSHLTSHDVLLNEQQHHDKQQQQRKLDAPPSFVDHLGAIFPSLASSSGLDHGADGPSSVSPKPPSVTRVLSWVSPFGQEDDEGGRVHHHVPIGDGDDAAREEPEPSAKVRGEKPREVGQEPDVKRLRNENQSTSPQREPSNNRVVDEALAGGAGPAPAILRLRPNVGWSLADANASNDHSRDDDDEIILVDLTSEHLVAHPGAVPRLPDGEGHEVLHPPPNDTAVARRLHQLMQSSPFFSSSAARSYTMM